MPLKHHDFTAVWLQIGAKGPAPIPYGVTFQAHLGFAKLRLRGSFANTQPSLKVAMRGTGAGILTAFWR